MKNEYIMYKEILNKITNGSNPDYDYSMSEPSNILSDVLRNINNDKITYREMEIVIRLLISNKNSNDLTHYNLAPFLECYYEYFFNLGLNPQKHKNTSKKVMKFAFDLIYKSKIFIDTNHDFLYKIKSPKLYKSILKRTIVVDDSYLKSNEILFPSFEEYINQQPIKRFPGMANNTHYSYNIRKFLENTNYNTFAEFISFFKYTDYLADYIIKTMIFYRYNNYKLSRIFMDSKHISEEKKVKYIKYIISQVDKIKIPEFYYIQHLIEYNLKYIKNKHSDIYNKVIFDNIIDNF